MGTPRSVCAAASTSKFPKWAVAAMIPLPRARAASNQSQPS